MLFQSLFIGVQVPSRFLLRCYTYVEILRGICNSIQILRRNRQRIRTPL